MRRKVRCKNPAAYRYTAPNGLEKLVCEMHSYRVMRWSAKMGHHVVMKRLSKDELEGGLKCYIIKY